MQRTFVWVLSSELVKGAVREYFFELEEPVLSQKEEIRDNRHSHARTPRSHFLLYKEMALHHCSFIVELRKETALPLMLISIQFRSRNAKKVSWLFH